MNVEDGGLGTSDITPASSWLPYSPLKNQVVSTHVFPKGFSTKASLTALAFTAIKDRKILRNSANRNLMCRNFGVKIPAHMFLAFRVHKLVDVSDT